MKYFVFVSMLLVVGGCGNLRFAPGEAQKQNAWLHHETAVAAAGMAKDENTSAQLQKLTTLSAEQSDAVVSYYGMPQHIIPASSIDEIVAQSNFELAKEASTEAEKRPNVWDVADNLFELGIGLAGLLGGMYGVRTVRFLQEAKNKATALKEIVEGNELFKKQNAEMAGAFKTAQNGQSTSTRQIVAGIK